MKRLRIFPKYAQEPDAGLRARRETWSGQHHHNGASSWIAFSEFTRDMFQAGD